MTDVRRQVLEAVRRWPGIHARALERELGLASKLGSYHLQALESEGQVQHVSEPGYTRYFPRSAKPRLGRREVEFTCLARRPVALRIVLHLLACGEAGNKELAASLRLAKAGITYHVHLLNDAGIVTVREDGRRRRVRLTDPSWVNGMLASFTPLPDESEAFESVWGDLFGGQP